jgi:5'/3'-nucleotidase
MRKISKIYLIVFALLLCGSWAFGQVRYHHILITNDDGIEDADRLLALARSVKNCSERVSIIVSAFDRSGTSNHSLYGKHQSTFEVTCVYSDPKNNISAYTLPANPADCVMMGMGGFFGDDQPDLVLAGINSGPNIGPDWFGSGTVGAARTAAFVGVRAIAFSGFDDDYEKSFSVIPDWITELISSGFLEGMDRFSYLTIGFPTRPFEEIKGIRIVDRRISYDKPEMFRLKKIHGDEPHAPENTTIWALETAGDPIRREEKHDDSYLDQGYIVITPMTIDENHVDLMRRLEEKARLIPDLYK